MKKSINSELREELQTLFPILIVEDLIEEFKRNNVYKSFSISPFDHILSDLEAKNQIISYSDDLRPAEQSRFNEIEKNYLKAYRKIYEDNTIYLFEENSSGFDFYSLSKEEFIKACMLNIREKELFLIAVPEKRVLIQGDYDHGVNCYCLDQTGLEYFKKMFVDYGFHILGNVP